MERRQPQRQQTESFTISGMFLPYGWVPRISLMRQYDLAKAKLEEGGEEAMIVFTTHAWPSAGPAPKKPPGGKPCSSALEPYKLTTVPAWACVLTAAIDCQGLSARTQSAGLGRGHGMGRRRLPGSSTDHPPSKPPGTKPTSCCAAGAATPAAPCSASAPPWSTPTVKAALLRTSTTSAAPAASCIYAIKGHSRPGRPILSSKPTLVDITWRSKTEKQGAQLWFVGPTPPKTTCRPAGKDQRRRPLQPGPARELLQGLTAEYRTYGYKRGRKVSWWGAKKGEATNPSTWPSTTSPLPTTSEPAQEKRARLAAAARPPHTLRGDLLGPSRIHSSPPRPTHADPEGTAEATTDTVQTSATPAATCTRTSGPPAVNLLAKGISVCSAKASAVTPPPVSAVPEHQDDPDIVRVILTTSASPYPWGSAPPARRAGQQVNPIRRAAGSYLPTGNTMTNLSSAKIIATALSDSTRTTKPDPWGVASAGHSGTPWSSARRFKAGSQSQPVFGGVNGHSPRYGRNHLASRAQLATWLDADTKSPQGSPTKLQAGASPAQTLQKSPEKLSTGTTRSSA